MSPAPIIITGASSGMGKAAALQLAGAGIPLVLILREGQKGRDAHAEIVQISGNRAVEIEIADLASRDDIRSAATRIAERYPQIRAFVSNAGVQFNERRLSPDGIELTFAINHLAPFLLTHMLFGPLKAHGAASDAPARVVINASDMQLPFDFDDYNRDRAYRGWPVYGQSKLANVLFTFALAKRLDGTGITANCLAPGFVRTDLFRDAKGLRRLLFNAFGRFVMSSPERAARKIVRLATDPELDGANGLYFRRDKPAKAADAAYDAEAQARLWALSEQLTGLNSHSAPGVN
jgi:NAD(P)-dependent dehydrogenase (short-subunit alcohol dehydrogenase family)